MGLAGAAVADGDDVLPAVYVLAPGQLGHQLPVHRRDRKEVEGVEALDRREACSPDASLHHAVVSVYELQFRQPEQVVWVVHPLGGALGCHLPVLPEEGRQPKLPEVVFQQDGWSVVHDALPDRSVM